MFKTQVKIRFRDTDLAKIMFFAQIFDLTHDVYEEFVAHLGFEWKDWFQNPQIGIPIRHTEADYQAPLRPGETYDVAVSVAHLGDSSMKLKYVFTKAAKTHAEVQMVHTFLDIAQKTKTSIPSHIREKLEKHLAK